MKNPGSLNCKEELVIKSLGILNQFNQLVTEEDTQFELLRDPKQ